MLLASLLTTQTPPAPPAPSAPSRVIVVLIDGVRWQDVFDVDGSRFPTHPAMPQLQKLASEGALWGNKAKGSSARTISKIPYSLPGYQSIFTGHQTSCTDNACPRVTDETFLDRFADSAVFASWAGLGNAAARDPKALHVDVPPWGETTPGPPWENARWDSATWMAATSYVEQRDPRLLVISFLDTDEWAHEGHDDGYRAALVYADARIGDLVRDLKKRDVWRDTTLIVSTDHGRNKNWRNHGDDDEGRDVFVGVFGRRAPREAKGNVSHADIRPTVEDALGLAPTTTTTGRSLLLR